MSVSASSLETALLASESWMPWIRISVVQAKLLTALHWTLPHPLSEPEARFQNRELPALERDVRQLSDTLRVRFRWRCHYPRHSVYTD